MKKIILKTTLFIVLLISLSFAWQYMIDKGLRRSVAYGNLYSDWDSIYKGGIDADVLILGSSRAAIHVDPQVILDSLNRSCINLGINGHKFLTQYYKYFIYEEHNKKPKSIVLCLDIFSLIHTEEFFEYEQFIPYLNDTLVKDIVKPFDFFTWKDFYIPMVKFTHRKDMILDGTYAFFRPSQIKNSRQRGFHPVDKPWDTSFVNSALKIMYADGYTAKIDSQTNQLFVHFIDYCKNNNIRLLFVYPPEYIGNLYLCKNRQYVMDYYNTIAKEKDVPYFNYSSSSLCSDTTYFFDSQHLNTKGVKLFNNQLVKDIEVALTK